MNTIFAYSGAIASVWLVIGVIVAASFYPGYSHRRQFCSELGAVGSPTQRLSPAINNYPLGALFILFGVYLMGLEDVGLHRFWIGLLVIIHGVGTWVAGFFPMDRDPFTTTPSLPCKIHSWAGVVMLLSLLVAPLLVCFNTQYELWLRLMSAVSVLGCVVFSIGLAAAYKAKTNLGTYQRLSYGCQLLWLFGYSLLAAG